MEELRKVARVAARRLPGAPHETLLVLDGTVGQNAVQQGRLFTQAVSPTGIVVTKLDGSARGGRSPRSDASWDCPFASSAWVKGSTISSRSTRAALRPNFSPTTRHEQLPAACFPCVSAVNCGHHGCIEDPAQ